MTVREALLQAPQIPLRFVTSLNPRPRRLLPSDSVYVPMEAISKFNGLDATRVRPTNELVQGYSYLEDGDVAFAKVTPCFENGKGVHAVDIPGGYAFATTEITVLRPRPKLHGPYLSWILQSEEFRRKGEATMAGAGGLKRVPEAFAAGFRIALPDLKTQQSIADYLDRETAQIDAFIAKNEQLIALLIERRASAIVVELQGFPTIPLKRLVQPARPLTYGILQCGDPVPGGVPYIGPADIPGEGRSPERGLLRTTTDEIALAYRRSTLAGGDIVVSIGPAFGRVALLADDLTGANLTQDTVRVATVADLVDPHYLVRVLSSRVAFDYWDYEITGATFRRLNLGTLAETPIPLPPPKDQELIAERIVELTSALDRAFRSARLAVALAKERRSALISAAVTGQIEIEEQS